MKFRIFTANCFANAFFIRTEKYQSILIVMIEPTTLISLRHFIVTSRIFDTLQQMEQKGYSKAQSHHCVAFQCSLNELLVVERDQQPEEELPPSESRSL